MKKFNIRVYALIFNENKEVLLTEETHGGKFMRKFPGGGLQWGESLGACLSRELLEEFNVQLLDSELYHVTDTVQISFFNPNDQVLAIYFKCRTEGPFIPLEPNLRVKWVNIQEVIPETCTFPSDIRVMERLKNESYRET